MHIKTPWLFIVLLGAFLFLTSCEATPAETPTPSPAPTSTIAPVSATSAGSCTTIAAKPTPNVSSALPAVTGDDFKRGPDDAPVKLLAYCDFQSASCQAFGRILDQLHDAHPDDLQIVFRPVPAIKYIDQLDKTQITVQAVLAAGDQGKFWDLRDVMVDKYTEWSGLSVNGFESWVTKQAVGLGLDGDRFQADMKSSETEARARSMYETAAQLNLSIPMAFLNGSLQPSYVLDYASLDSTISLIALGARQFQSCPPFDIDPSKQYIATLHTQKGDIVIQFYAKQAPLAVNSFVFLAKQGWFDGVTFHRVIPGFVAQAGDPSGTGRGGPGYFFRNEIVPDLRYDKPGVVGMANSGPDTNGSQFFITFAPQPKLDGAYTIFGQVIQGMDVVEALTPRDPSTSNDLPPGDKIVSVTIEEK